MRWAAGAGTAFGPYMRAIPNNPFTTTNVVTGAITGIGDWTYIAGANGTYTFQADDGGTAPDGTLHVNY